MVDCFDIPEKDEKFYRIIRILGLGVVAVASASVGFARVFGAVGDGFLVALATTVLVDFLQTLFGSRGKK